MYIMGVGLVKSLQHWDIVVIYCNNYFKRYTAPLLRLGRGAFSIPLLMSTSEVLCPFFTLLKLCFTEALEWSSLVPGPEAKSSSSEITNPTWFSLSYQDHPSGRKREEWNWNKECLFPSYNFLKRKSLMVGRLYKRYASKYKFSF